MKSVNVAISILGDGASSFFFRATKRATSGYSKQVGTGQAIIQALIDYSADKNITMARVDIIGHGYYCGVIGAKSNWEGLFTADAQSIPSSVKPNSDTCMVKPGLGGASVKTLAEAITKGEIRISTGGEFNFFPCNSYDLAMELSKDLLATITSVTAGGGAGVKKERWPSSDLSSAAALLGRPPVIDAG